MRKTDHFARVFAENSPIGRSFGRFGFPNSFDCESTPFDRTTMTWLYTDPRFLDHDTRRHPERALTARRRSPPIWMPAALTAKCAIPTWQPASLERIDARPSTGLRRIDRRTRCARRRSTRFRHRRQPGVVSTWRGLPPARPQMPSTASSPAMTEPRSAWSVRPATTRCPDRAMGFCLFNNVAVAARVATDEHELDRVLIVDWDVHHGNGTQDMFYADGRVGFFSVHRWPFYPGTGAADETGTGDGLGATHNLPVLFGTSREKYRDMFRLELENFAARIRPQLVLVERRFRRPPRRPDRLARLGSRRLRRPDADCARRRGRPRRRTRGQHSRRRLQSARASPNVLRLT